jgi:hypothetical protein
LARIQGWRVVPASIGKSTIRNLYELTLGSMIFHK